MLAEETRGPGCSLPRALPHVNTPDPFPHQSGQYLCAFRNSTPVMGMATGCVLNHVVVMTTTGQLNIDMITLQKFAWYRAGLAAQTRWI